MKRSKLLLIGFALLAVCVIIAYLADFLTAGTPQHTNANVVLMFFVPPLYLTLLCIRRTGLQFYVLPSTTRCALYAALLLVLWFLTAIWVPIPYRFGYRLGFLGSGDILAGDSLGPWIACFFRVVVLELAAYTAMEIRALRQFNRINTMLTKECDPQKYLAAAAPICARIQLVKPSPRSANTAVALTNEAAALYESGETEQARERLMTLLDSPLLQNTKYAYIRCNIYTRLSNVYRRMNDSNNARRFMLEARSAAESYHGKNKKILSYLKENETTISAGLALLDDTPEAALPIWQRQEGEATTPIAHALIHCRLAETYRALGDEKLAFHYLEMAEQIAPKLYTVRITRELIQA